MVNAQQNTAFMSSKYRIISNNNLLTNMPHHT